MDINECIESPLELKISFKKLFEAYEVLLKSDDVFVKSKAKRILDIAQVYPELKAGFRDVTILKTRKKEIEIILQDTFSPLLTKNEIKAASVPFHNFVFNSSERFKSIISQAGDGYELEMKSLPNDELYIIACTVILNVCYGYNITFKRPFYYEIPDANGVLQYYKILYNADFCEIVATNEAKKITKEDYFELLDNFENIELWKEKFPPNSYQFNGFVISNMFSVTDDQAISQIKSYLIDEDSSDEEHFMNEFEEVFRSLFGFRDLNIGFCLYSKEEGIFEDLNIYNIKSFLLQDKELLGCTEALCDWSYNRIINQQKFYSISDIKEQHKISKGRAPHINALHKQGFGSAILVPISNEEGLMGLLELVSTEPKRLNSVNANKLNDVMPFISAAFERSIKAKENLIEAVIQQECTSIHTSVYWKFVDAAKQFLKDKATLGKKASFQSVVFENVYPLYGQIDVKGSSEARNLATQKDLLLQLSLLEKIMKDIVDHEALPIYEQLQFQLNQYSKELKTNFKVDSEHTVVAFLKKEIDPLLKFQLGKNVKLKPEIEDYMSKLDEDLGLIYFYRKNYDETIMRINKNMSALLDEKQIEAQTMYPHYFERYKTDGVEHNMYIGESITKRDGFNQVYLYNLRLWQLQVMCEMENEYYNTQHKYPISLDVASMILVFNQPLSIRFRMDEKQFDVDGTYNARYEIVKKRVDKAFIKNTEERVTQKGKITIVYSQKADEQEYLRYVEFLQSKHYLDDDVEIVELQDLQGVTGLKAIRVSVLYHREEDDNKSFYTYEDLMKELKH
ncbi:GAF domain-containing protein [Tamlana fucoidanivorans]|uniref:GAF domain-containing protein n=1 Tax=Allotamlana fucoidanivorans TaxID=2583814 RepID=A0A5C4SNZ1_9FLAO|nr:GAF domain-containing protein [Tamlana fucoidanivorans]TNJ45202.1 GAF domain-containing protein [Tamlana fucoidanivorans]